MKTASKTEQVSRHPIDLSTEVLAILPNGGKVVVYNAIDRRTEDFRHILACATFFAKQGKQVVMPPKLDVPYKNPAYEQIFGSLRGTAYYGKCPDMLVDGVWYEHEGYTGNQAKKSFRNMCNHGSKQSARIVVDDCGLTDGYMLRSIASRLAIGIDIQEVWIRYEERLRLLYKKLKANDETIDPVRDESAESSARITF